MRGRQSTLATLATVAVALASCSGPGSSSATPSSTAATIGPSATSSTTPTPGDSHTPASTAQGATEATSGLSRYRETVDRVFQSGGRLKEELATVAVARQLMFLRQQADFLAQQNQKQTGEVHFGAVRSVTMTPAKNGLSPSATITLCSDSSRREVVDSTGRNVLPPNIPKVFLATFTLVNTKGGTWLVASEQDQQVKSCD